MNNNQTGPRTPAGKSISAQNATRHGCCSTATLILPNEKLEDYKALEATWFRSYEPTDKAEEHLIHQLVTADWFLTRAIATYAEVEARIFAQNPDPLAWDHSHHQTLARFLRYKTTHTNNVVKHRRAIEEYRRNRTSETHKAGTPDHRQDPSQHLSAKEQARTNLAGIH